MRQSRAKETTISIGEQRRDIRRWAESAGVTLADEVIEQGVSGNKSWRDRELGTAIQRCKDGEAGGIIVAWQDRLSREKASGSAEVWEALAGYRLVVANEGIDTANGGNQTLIFSIKAAIARDQWERYQANWKRAKHNAWERRVHTSRAPVGYRIGDDGKLVQSEYAQIIRRGYELRASGVTWAAIAASFSEAGVPSAHGNTSWGVSTATQIFSNPIYKGVFRCKCGCGSEARVPELALVGPSLWDQVQPRRTGRGGRRIGSGNHLLSGLLRCAACGFQMQASATTKKGKTYSYYRCSNWGTHRCVDRPVIPAPMIEEYLIQAAFERTEYRVEEPEIDTAPLEAAVEIAENELRSYQLAVTATTPGFGEAVTARAQTLADAQRELDDAQQRGGVTVMTAAEMRRIFDSGELHEQQAVLRELLPRGATVRRGPRLPVEQRVVVAPLADEPRI
jgi:DNA invertase Pin-like site-specific DNA recombinase